MGLIVRFRQYVFLWGCRFIPVRPDQPSVDARQPQPKEVQPLIMQRGKQTVWTTGDTWGTFQRLENPPEAVAKSSLRLVQMRKLAREFKVVDEMQH